jgi:predicted nucleotidyltransferase
LGVTPTAWSHHPEAAAILDQLTAWAESRLDIVALALVGSVARGEPHPRSDVDLVLITCDPEAYVRDEEWTAELGATGIIRARPWGPIIERRLVMPSGLEIDVGVAPLSWAGVTPVDPGTRQIVLGGLRILHDPQGLLAQLLAACGAEP